jgi:hypothetical protein
MDLAIRLYQEFNPGLPLRSPRPKYLIPPTAQSFGLRWFDPRRYTDMIDLINIDRQPILTTNMYPKTPSTIRYYRGVFNTQNNYIKDNYYVFAITSHSHQIIGWIQFMLDDYRSHIKKIAHLPHRSLILEVSYAKLFTTTHKYVARIALKQSVDIILKMNNNHSPNIFLTGYTDPQNVASESALMNNDFQKLDQQIHYIDSLSNIWIKKIK